MERQLQHAINLAHCLCARRSRPFPVLIACDPPQEQRFDVHFQEDTLAYEAKVVERRCEVLGLDPALAQLVLSSESQPAAGATSHPIDVRHLDPLRNTFTPAGRILHLYALDQLHDSYAQPRTHPDKSYALDPLDALSIAREVARRWRRSEVLLMNLMDPDWSSIRHLEADHVIAFLLEAIEQRAQDIIACLRHHHAAGMPQHSMRHPGMQQAPRLNRDFQLTVEVYSNDRDFLTLDQLDNHHTLHPLSAGVRFELCDFRGRPSQPESCSAQAYARRLALEGKGSHAQQKGKVVTPALKIDAAETRVLCHDPRTRLGRNRQAQTLR
jgi:HAMP domain-containing protein